MSGSYRLPDEPRPGALARIAVDPLWPMLGIMFGGAWLSWGWFALNAFALGTSTRWKEVGFVVAGFAGHVVLLLLVGLCGVLLGKDHPLLPYLAIVLTLWKLGVTYGLHHLQSQGFELYQWYGGKVAAVSWIAVAVFLLARRVNAALDGTLLGGLLQ